MSLANREALAFAGDDRGTWTAIAGGVFAAGGFLAAVVGTAILLLVLGDGIGSNLGGPITLEEVGAAVLWFVAPTVGAVVTGVPAWVLLVEVLGDRAIDPDGDRSRLGYLGLGGLAGATSGALAHVVMWVIIMAVVALYEGGNGVAEFLEMVLWGLVLGVLSIGATGIITIPILGATGLALGYARHRGATPDGGTGQDGARWGRLRSSPENS